MGGEKSRGGAKEQWKGRGTGMGGGKRKREGKVLWMREWAEEKRSGWGGEKGSIR